ncbi:MAG: AAA family ATPase, partial [Hyphomicrobiales bacterium]|nr:AAA family ATPase [Hyphomicrobiales bacterium]
LLAGARLGEQGLYVTLSESEHELRLVAKRHGWSLDPLSIFELVPPEATLDPEREQTLFHPAELELTETTKLIFDRVDLVKPLRVVFDSLSEMRLLAQNSLRYRRQILALKHFFAGRRCTVLLLDDLSSSDGDLHLHSIAHGVITLQQLALDYGAERRRLRVKKMRGIKFRGGYHDFAIQTGGIRVFPRLVAAEHHKAFIGELTSSGSTGLDALLGGGLERGTSVLLVGGAGVGKSSIAVTYAVSAARRGERVAMYAFDEGLGTLFARSAGQGVQLQELVDRGFISIQQIDPAEMSPGEFAHLVRDAVDKRNVRVLLIDSLNGYLNSMPDEQFLVLQMHELLSYLSQVGALTILVLAQHGLLGRMQTPIDLSYLSDAVIMLRYFEAGGRVRRAISVVKKRSGTHENTIREYQLTSEGLKVSAPLTDFNGILTGTPTYVGGPQPLMPEESNGR